MSSSSRNPHATQASRTPLLARLPAIQTLSYQRPGARGAPLLVDAGPEVLSANVGSGAGRALSELPGGYRLDTLLPGPRLQAWARGGAGFSLSRDGQVQVGWGRRLAATEFEALGDGQPGLAMLEPEEIRYLEAYLLWQGRRWSDAEDGIDAGPGEASAFDPFSGQARTRACVAESAGLSGLRILHTEAATSFGGQEFCIYKEMVAMRERGHHLEAVCQPQAELGGRLREAGFKVHNLLMDGPVNFLRGVSALRRVLRGGRFDVLNTHSRRDTVLASIGARLAGTPLIVRTRHLAKPIHSLYAYTWLAHRVIAVSRYVRGQLLEGGARPEAVEVIHSPVSLPPDRPGACLRRELSIPPEAKVVGCVAVMRAEKGHEDLIEAFSRVSRRHADAHLVLVGDGMPLAEQLRERVRALGQALARRIHFAGRRKDVGTALRAFDVFALPTRREAFGTVFVEAAAMGLPVIGTQVGGVPETMMPGRSGLLVPPNDPGALAQALDLLLGDAALRRRMGEAGRARVRDLGLFTPARVAQDVENVYHRWLSERRGTAA